MTSHPTEGGFLPPRPRAEAFEPGQLVAVVPGVLLVAPAAVALPVAPNAWVVLVGLVLTVAASFGVGHALRVLGVPQGLAITVLSTAFAAPVVMVLLLLTGRVGIPGWTGGWALAAVLGAVIVVVPALHLVDLRLLESELGFALAMLIAPLVVVMALALPVGDVVADHRFRSDLADRVAGSGIASYLPEIEGWEARSVDLDSQESSVDGITVARPVVTITYEGDAPTGQSYGPTFTVDLEPEGDACAAVTRTGDRDDCRSIVGTDEGAVVDDGGDTYVAVDREGALLTAYLDGDDEPDIEALTDAFVAAEPSTSWDLVRSACGHVEVSDGAGEDEPRYRFCRV
ncbi:hypothetical protein [Nocardioides alkalitolerans]|uniref:hypothetical protein n=1 Tax=Nocardioides alkalitolerans TaxID=281714 RepID=UPI000401F172|nr:hypothetical protein [Nocardioides alkalitolerans]